jgi:DNA adenine methylase
MTAPMTIKALSPWFGSKRTLAGRIVVELGPHRSYWEPFCGSMAVLLSKEPSTHETVNDLHGELVNLARVLANEAMAIDLYGKLSRMLVHEDLFHEAAKRWARRGNQPASEEADPGRALDFFISSWMGRNGVIGTKSYNQGFCVRYTPNGGSAATRWNSAVRSIPAWHRRLQSVTILNRDGVQLCERIRDVKGTAIYCDPPYLVKGATYTHDFRDGFMTGDNDHTRLALSLRSFRKARVVVSYYDHPALVTLYPGWTKIDCARPKLFANAWHASPAQSIAPEVLLVNGSAFGSEEPQA